MWLRTETQGMHIQNFGEETSFKKRQPLGRSTRWEKFENFTVMNIQGVVTPFSAVVGYQRFGGPCRLHLQSEDKE
jgi:hypothetical protein